MKTRRAISVGEKSPGDFDQFFPPPSPFLERWADRWCATAPAAYVVDLDGRRLPRLRPPTIDVCTIPREYGDQAVEVLLERETFRAVAEPTRKPGGNLRFRLEAAHMYWIEGCGYAEIGEYFGLKSQPICRAGELGERFRGAELIVQRGAADWAALGAWPFAVPDAEPRDWRSDPRVARALAEWHSRILAAETRVLVARAGRVRRAAWLLPSGGYDVSGRA
jgi:hypothetical protein